jgi:hypothetical protein
LPTGEKPDRDPTPEERGKSAVAVTSGSRGGKQRAANLSADRRREIAEKAAKPVGEKVRLLGGPKERV